MKKRNFKPFTILLAFTLLFSFIPKWFQPKAFQDCGVNYCSDKYPFPDIQEFDD